jgi:DNA-binding NtrC family response regulator
MVQNPPGLAVVRARARVFEDGLLGIKTPSELPPGEYVAVVVMTEGGAGPAVEPPPTSDGPIESLDDFLERMKLAHVRAALARAGGNRTQAAKLLGVDVRTVFRLLEKDDS